MLRVATDAQRLLGANNAQVPGPKTIPLTEATRFCGHSCAREIERAWTGSHNNMTGTSMSHSKHSALAGAIFAILSVAPTAAAQTTDAEAVSPRDQGMISGRVIDPGTG